MYTKKYTDRRVGFRAYPTAFQRVRRMSRNSTPHVGSSLGRSRRVGPRRRPEGSPEMSYECYFLGSFVPSFPLSSVTSGVGSGILSSGRSGVLRGPVRRCRRSVVRSLTSSLRSPDGSFGMSFLRSLAGRSWRPRFQFGGAARPFHFVDASRPLRPGSGQAPERAGRHFGLGRPAEVG